VQVQFASVPAGRLNSPAITALGLLAGFLTGAQHHGFGGNALPESAEPIGGIHLDASIWMHHDVNMRTTVTLDPDVDLLLKEQMRRTGTTFRQALNQAIRRALAGNVAAQRRPFKLKPRRLSLRPGLDPAMLQHLEEDLEVESFIKKTRKLSKS
jgi:hypothetical protein